MFAGSWFFSFLQTSEDTNLGKPWFHSSVGREEAVELLMKSKSLLLAGRCTCRSGRGQVSCISDKPAVSPCMITSWEMGISILTGTCMYLWTSTCPSPFPPAPPPTVCVEGTPGSFLVRKGSSRGGEDEVHYSMAVRTTSRVQRFLITRYATGYYLFGGRPFNSWVTS